LFALHPPLPKITSTGDALGIETVDARMLALMRCVLALSALFMTSLYPIEPTDRAELTDFSLAAYCLYSVILAVLSWRSDWPPPGRAVHWADVFFYGYLVALADSASSIFLYFFRSRCWLHRSRGDSERHLGHAGVRRAVRDRQSGICTIPERLSLQSHGDRRGLFSRLRLHPLARGRV
jgi:hypothetical protein